MSNILKFMAVVSIALTFMVSCKQAYKPAQDNSWEIVTSQFTPRHESNLVATTDGLYLIGGRGIKPVEQFSHNTGQWQSVKTSTPIELHHFQARSLPSNQGKKSLIYIIGAFTGPWPNETPVDKVLTFDTDTHMFNWGADIPKPRLRGASATAVYKDKIFIVGGSTKGHMSGTVAWFDEYDPATKTFTSLPDAPHARDHAQAVVVGNKLYSLSGRLSSRETNNDFDLTLSAVDVYDFETGQWQTLGHQSQLKVPRAGANAMVVGRYIVLAGGESAADIAAHNEVAVFDTQEKFWFELPNLQQGRHSGGAAYVNNTLYVTSGSGKRGGSPELATYETLSISEQELDILSSTALLANSSETEPAIDTSLFEPVEIDVYGPQVSETDANNPFLHYVMISELLHQSGKKITLRGFFAADGVAKYSSASEGNVWRSMFTPELSGTYRYSSKLYSGKNVALANVNDLSAYEVVSQTKGQILVAPKPKAFNRFSRNGFLRQKDGYFYFPKTAQYWLKGGTNSPENFLAYWEIDGTYRHSAQAREGEASSGKNLHEFKAHVKDWRVSDALWGQQKNKGKALIGAINYLAKQGINAQYFLSMNINGDGRDVWPYLRHDEFDRFDVSKLDQWQHIFQHMQHKEILIHLVTQETENERLLDKGELGQHRQLYYLELIARFAHHKALVWNMGEENGPASWSPDAQNDQQRLQMASFFKQHDPYQHPIFIHSHATAESKDELLHPLLDSDYSGVSFQVDARAQVFDEIRKWRRVSKKSSDAWLITMDEIGKWHVGARVDADDPTHDTLRQHVLWPTLLAGGAGVEWYAGAHQAHNDLGLEDFRTRENLWKQTFIARNFMEQYVPFWELVPQATIKDSSFTQKEYDNQRHYTKTIAAASQYVSKSKTVLLAYLIRPIQFKSTVFESAVFESVVLKSTMPQGIYEQMWLNPISGQIWRKDNIEVSANVPFQISMNQTQQEQDWLILLRLLPNEKVH